MFNYEKRLWKRGIKFVAGIDEVGRGPLAGPIVAAAVILPKNYKISGLDDSKKITPKKRERIYYEIRRKALAIAIGKVSHRAIDKLNIYRANLLAMKMAIEKLKIKPHYLLIDGERNVIDCPIPQRGICGGDRKCASIAAASIIAKVTRDRMMVRYHQKYPNYGFDRHKGYGTKEHFQKIFQYGPSSIHRRSFYPLKTA